MLQISYCSILSYIRRTCLYNTLRFTGDQAQLPPEPTTCCMSGCANCVWIEYAKEVSRMLGDDGPELAKAKIMENVKDPNVRSFLLMELQSMPKSTSS